jgi:hypothetical protein
VDTCAEFATNTAYLLPMNPRNAFNTSSECEAEPTNKKSWC